MKVLVVEDNASLLESMRQILEDEYEAGYSWRTGK